MCVCLSVYLSVCLSACLSVHLLEPSTIVVVFNLVVCSLQLFGSVDELLRKAPMLRSTVGHTRAELYRQWQEWRAECCRRRDAGGLVAVPQLLLLCRVSEALSIARGSRT